MFASFVNHFIVALTEEKSVPLKTKKTKNSLATENITMEDYGKESNKQEVTGLSLPPLFAFYCNLVRIHQWSGKYAK